MSEVSVESFQSLQEQLQITQELLNKQERNKLRLKGELSGTQHELSKLKMELAETRKRLVQTEAAVVELEAAKELLVSYSSDLQTSQEAHAISLDLIFKTSDRQYHTTAMELVSFHKLLHDGYSLTYREKKPKAMIPDRKWDFDEDWDSDRDVPDVDCWWRNQDPYFSTEPEINDTPILRKRQSVSEILQGSTVPVKKGINKRRTIHISQLPPIHHSPDQLPPLDNFPRIHDTLDQPSIDDIGEETFLLQSQLQKDSIATLFRRKSIAEMKRAKIPNSTNQSWSVLPSWLKYGQKEP
jgi:hypothetical protein